ncbi:AGAP009884-PA, partial [Anopheles gambiae str. PEST]
MEDFTDPSRNLGSIIHWTPESFTMNCRTFLNNIPERKYYSLAATSAAIGSNAICPLGGKNFISFEWNSNPAELSFEASLAENLNRSFEASIELNDIQSLTIVEDLYAPRVECSYEKIQITDDSIVTYDLNINALNNEELGVLAQLVKTMIHPEKLVYKPLRPAAEEDEVF